MIDLESLKNISKFKEALSEFDGQLSTLVRFSDVRDTPLKGKLNQEDFGELSTSIAANYASIKSLNEYGKEKISLSCGDEKLDSFLGGGFLTQGNITEITGVSGSGKTQLAVQLCLAVQLPRDFNGLDGGAVYLSSENAFPLPRLLQMTEGFKERYPIMKNKDLTANVFIRKIELSDCSSLLRWRLPALLDAQNIRLIILDSIAGLFRGEVTQATQRAKYLHVIGHRLKELSIQYGVAVLCINQVSARMNHQNGPYELIPLATEYGKYPNVNVAQHIPAMGLAWSNEINVRIMLSRKTGMVSRHLSEELARESEDEKNSNDREDEDNNKDKKNEANYRKRFKHENPDNIRRQLHIMFAPHLAPKSIDFVIEADGVFGMDNI